MHTAWVILRVGELMSYIATPQLSWVGYIIGFDPDLDIGFGTELPVFGHMTFGVMLSKHYLFSSSHRGLM